MNRLEKYELAKEAQERLVRLLPPKAYGEDEDCALIYKALQELEKELQKEYALIEHLLELDDIQSLEITPEKIIAWWEYDAIKPITVMSIATEFNVDFLVKAEDAGKLIFDRKQFQKQ